MSIEIREEKRANWGTRAGFVLAAVGSAVGLGNLWGFPYKLYTYGGGAFLIPYIAALVLVGIPMLILEFSLGHYAQRAAPDAFATAHRRFEVIGWCGILMGFVIITYYPIILAYCFMFLWESIKGIATGGELPWAGQGIEGVKLAQTFFFDTCLNHQEGVALGALQRQVVLPLAIAWLTMYLCIFRGVRLVGRIVWLTVPLPWLMLLILTIRGLTLEGSGAGLVFYLEPQWIELAKPSTWRFAFGQVFFSLSLAFGVMITYASFLHKKSDLNNNAAIIGLADLATSFVAGLAVFATLGAMAFATRQAGHYVPVEQVAEKGVSLAFVAFPYALAQLPGSAWFSFVFFLALVTLGIDSAFSITESVLASIVDKTGWRRGVVLPVMSLVGFSVGLVYATRGGLNWLDTIDTFVNGTWGIAFLGLLQCVVLGWLFRLDRLRKHANERSDWRLGRWWNFFIRTLIPVFLGALFVWSLFEDLTRPAGFLRDTATGGWRLQNVVGALVLLAVPILAWLIARRGSVRRTGEAALEDKLPCNLAREQGRVALVAAVAALVCACGAFVLAAASSPAPAGATHNTLVLVLLAAGALLGLTGLAIATRAIVAEERNTTESVAWIVRWAGLAATTAVGAVLGLGLVVLTRSLGIPESAPIPIRGDQLGAVAYALLSVVGFILVGGLGWCFFRAIMATDRGTREPA